MLSRHDDVLTQTKKYTMYFIHVDRREKKIMCTHLILLNLLTKHIRLLVFLLGDFGIFGVHCCCVCVMV